MPLCLIGLGSNLGDRSGLLDEALVRLQRHPNIEVTRQSPYHETLPVGGPDAQPAYLNAAAVLQTPLSPQALLAELQKTEVDLGRQRSRTLGTADHRPRPAALRQSDSGLTAIWSFPIRGWRGDGLFSNRPPRLPRR